MGLLDGIAKQFLTNLSGGEGKNPLLDIALGLLANPQTGGLQGLMETFRNKGMADTLSSWISTGENQPISAGQILNVLGQNQIRRMANEAGISQEEAASGLADLLPQVIDKLTPNGKLPDGNLLEEAFKMFQGKTQL